MLPVDNEGDYPVKIWHDAVLTRYGRLLNAVTGKIESRHALEYTANSPITLVRIDGESVTQPGDARERYCLPLYDYDKAPIEALLKRHGLELSSYYPCFASAHGISVAVSCIPPAEFATGAGSRLYRGGPKENVQHFLIVSDSDCTTILEQYDLGSFFIAQLDWADNSLFSVTAQTYKEFLWSYRRQLWVFEWPDVT